MKVHNTLEELLEQHQIWLTENKITGSNAYGNAVMFLRSNSLALGKPEPLAKNKQFDSVCEECSGDGIVITTDFAPCTGCNATGIKQT